MNLNQWTLSPSLIQANFGILTQHLHQLVHRHLQMFQLAALSSSQLKRTRNVIGDLQQACPKASVGFKVNPICPLPKDACYTFWEYGLWQRLSTSHRKNSTLNLYLKLSAWIQIGTLRIHPISTSISFKLYPSPDFSSVFLVILFFLA